jgi:hypothetical protein
MKLRLVGCKSREVCLGIGKHINVYRDGIIDVPKENAESLLSHNNKDRIMWEEVKSKKKGDD